MKFNGPFRPGYALLAALIAVSGVFCLATSFSVPMGSWIPVVACLIFFALLCELSFCYKRGFLIFFTVFLAACLLAAKKALPSIEYLLYTISRYYDSAYGWGVIHWSSATAPTAVSANPALIFTGYLIIIPVMWTLRRKKWVGFGLLTGILPLAACCVVTDTTPDIVCLLGLLIGLLLLLLTQLTRRQSQKDASRLTAILLVPVMLFVSVLLLSSLRDSHQRQAQSLREQFEAIFSLQDGPDTGLNISVHIPTTQVNLSNVGPRDPSDEVVLQVQADYTGIIYLRGQSYDTYTGSRWQSTLDTSGEGGWPTSGLFHAGEMTVTTFSKLSLKYFPYYISDDDGNIWTEDLSNGKLANPNRETSYTFQWGLAHSSRYTPFRGLSDTENTAYLDLPVTTRNTARRIVADLTNSDSTTGANAANIASYVRNSASYDLNTQAMPKDADDFALWFLEESDTGYCVHFATAATVLLRAAGIPARYVTGYIAYALPGVSVDVTEAQAHAWVEYLDPEQGWTVLEATPGAQSIPEVPVPTETSQPDETTQPIETTSPTDPEGSTETTPVNTAPQQSEPAETQPQTTDPADEPSDTVPGRDLQWLKTLGWILAVCFLIAAQYVLRLRLRAKRLNKGSPNRLALRRWQYVCRLAKLTRQAAPGHLKVLAEKAAFSQHRLTHEELAQFNDWIRAAHEKLLDKPQPLKLLLRLILAI